jgi:hypothetical protein
MIPTPKWLGLLAVAFVAGSFIASPELRAYAANTIGSSDIINESILSEDIKNSQIKASDIAPDAVGGSELQGVSKILFGVCGTSELGVQGWGAGAVATVTCTINGADTDDSVIAMLDGHSNTCYGTRQAWVASSNTVKVNIGSDCSTLFIFNTASTLAVIVYDK